MMLHRLMFKCLRDEFESPDIVELLAHMDTVHDKRPTIGTPRPLWEYAPNDDARVPLEIVREGEKP